MGIEHETSSPYNSTSNRLEESAVKAVKTLMKKTEASNSLVLERVIGSLINMCRQMSQHLILN